MLRMIEEILRKGMERKRDEEKRASNTSRTIYKVREISKSYLKRNRLYRNFGTVILVCARVSKRSTCVCISCRRRGEVEEVMKMRRNGYRGKRKRINWRHRKEKEFITRRECIVFQGRR